MLAALHMLQMLHMLQNCKESDWTKRDAIVKHCGNRLAPDAIQFWGSQAFIKKTPGTMELVRAWKNGMMNYSMINDEPSKRPNSKTFREHRHDQSILSLLLNCRYSNSGRSKMQRIRAPLDQSLLR